MSRDPWFKCDPIDFLEGLETLNTGNEVAVYVAVIFRIYASGGPIPNNAAAIAPFARVPINHTKRIIAALIDADKLRLVGSKLSNPRAEAEIERRKSLSKKRSEVGRTGGRPRSDLGRTSAGPQPDPSRISAVRREEMAENSGSEKPIAFYARARGEEIREESSPTPPNSAPGLDRAKPNFDEPIGPDERARLVAGLDITDRDGPDVDAAVVASLTGHIMREARMTAPPVDIVLVGSWLRLGGTPEMIRATTTRMAAVARGGVRGMRYFDGEIRRQIEAETAAEDSTIAHFKRISARHGS